VNDVQTRLTEACAAACRLVATIRETVATRSGGSGGLINLNQQHAAHGFTWYATYEQVLQSLLGWVAMLAVSLTSGSRRMRRRCIGPMFSPSLTVVPTSAGYPHGRYIPPTVTS